MAFYWAGSKKGCLEFSVPGHWHFTSVAPLYLRQSEDRQTDMQLCCTWPIAVWPYDCQCPGARLRHCLLKWLWSHSPEWFESCTCSTATCVKKRHGRDNSQSTTPSWLWLRLKPELKMGYVVVESYRMNPYWFCVRMILNNWNVFSKRRWESSM